MISITKLQLTKGSNTLNEEVNVFGTTYEPKKETKKKKKSHIENKKENTKLLALQVLFFPPILKYLQYFTYKFLK